MIKKSVVGIIGFGFVGRAIQHGFAQQCDFRIYDIDKLISENTFEEVAKDSDYIFISVPTPMKKRTGQFDSSILDFTIESLYPYVKDTEKIVIIKSTCLPGTTKKYQEEYPKAHIVFSPEFLTARTSKLDFINPSRIIFGVSSGKSMKLEIEKIDELYRPRFPSYQLNFTDPTTAEMVKYVSNCFFATKVSFFNEMKQICDKSGIRYDRLIKYVLMDGRIGNSHWQVPGHDGELGFGGTCVLPKAKVKLLKNNTSNILSIKTLYDTYGNNFYKKKDVYIESCDSTIQCINRKKIKEVTRRKYVGDLYEFKTSTGTFTCTPDHLLPILRDNKLYVVKAIDIKDNDLLYNSR